MREVAEARQGDDLRRRMQGTNSLRLRRRDNEKLDLQLYQHVIVLQTSQRVEITRFPDRHFWHGGYDKANKGETRNSLARAVFLHRLGEIRDRTYENQQHRASGLNLLVTAIILWNTRYLERAVAALREIENVPDRLLAHLSPLGWEHVNLTGDYIWGVQYSVSENTSGMRPLRTIADAFVRAA